jgi:hypothetical protein
VGVTGGKLRFEWSGTAQLQEADNLAGPWTVVPAASGYVADMGAARKYYRLKY